MANSIKDLLAKKKAAQAGATPAKTNKKPAKPEVEEEEDGAEETGAEEEGDGEEEEEAAPAKKPAKKPAAAPAKKPAKKAAAKPAAKKASKDEDEVPAKAAKKGSTGGAWGAKKDTKEKRELKPGSWMPQDEFFSRFHEKLVELGIAPPTKSVTIQVVKAFEEFMKETLADYDVKFIEKTRRREMEARVYAPNTELKQVATPYHTLVSPHTKVSLNLYFGKEMTRGTVDDDGEFIEGQFDAKGNFTKGKWGVDDEGNETFTPAKKAAKK